MLLKMLLIHNQCELKSLNDQELEKFLDRGQLVDGVRYPTKYISEQGEAWGIFHLGKMIGGYVIATKGPLRTMVALEANGIKHNYRNDEVIELGGVWIEKEYRQKKYSTCIWLHMLSRIKAYKRPFLIYGYNLQRTGLQKLYSGGNPHILFRGPLGNKVGTVSTHSTASIEVVNTRTAANAMIFKSIARVFGFFLVKSEKIPSFPNKETNVESIEAHRRVLPE